MKLSTKDLNKWVISKVYNNPIQVTKNIIDSNAVNQPYYDFKYWTPNKNELCWFWNKNSNGTISYILANFREINDKKLFVNEIDNVNIKADWWENIEPFIGMKPTFLRI